VVVAESIHRRFLCRSLVSGSATSGMPAKRGGRGRIGLALEFRGSREEVGRRGTQVVRSAGITHLAGNVETQLCLGTPIAGVSHEGFSRIPLR
jgi:hypothetical protein